MATINPFQAPINYSVDVQSPFEAALGGFKIGAAGAEAQVQAQAREQALKAQTELRTLFTNPNATAADFDRVSAFLPKDQAEGLRSISSRMTTAQQQGRLGDAGQVYSALKAGEPEIAKTLLQSQISAFRNSGREQDAKATETYLELIGINPVGAQSSIGLMMAMMPGGKEILENIDKTLSTGRTEALAPAALKKAAGDADKAVADAKTAQETATNAPEKAKADAARATAEAESARIKSLYEERTQIAGLNKTNWDIKNLNSQIRDRSEKLGIDRKLMEATVADKFSAIQARLTDIPEGARKLINESSTLAASSKQAATQYNDLANRIQSAEGGKGALTTATEWFAKSLGQQDAWSQIRNEYTRIRNSVAIKALPPGPATDKDIELALKGIPPENSNSTTLASFLRGTAKLQDIDSSINNAKTDWLSQNNGLLTRAKGTFIAGDYATKPGETFNDFAQRIVGDVSKRYAPPPSAVGQIPAARQPQSPAQVDIRSRADAILKGG